MTSGRISDQWFGIGSEEGKVEIFDIATSRSAANLCGHPSSVSAIGFDRSDSQVMAGCQSGSLWLWDICTSTHLLSLPGHRSEITVLEYHPFGSFFVTCSTDANLKVWDPRSGKCVQTYRGHRAAISALSFSPHGKWIVSGDCDGCVKFWDIGSGKLFAETSEHDERVSSICFHPNDFFLMTGSEDKTVKLWSCESEVCLAVSSDTAASAVDRIVFRPDGSGLFVAHANGSLHEFKCDLANQQIQSVNEIQGFWNSEKCLLDLVFAKSSNSLVGISLVNDRMINLFDVSGTTTASPISTPTIIEPAPPAVSIVSVLESRLVTTRTVCALVNRGNVKEAVEEAIVDLAVFTSLLNSVFSSRNCVCPELGCLILKLILSKNLLTLPYIETQATFDQITRLPFSDARMLPKIGCRDSSDCANFSSTVSTALNVVTHLNKKFREETNTCELGHLFAEVVRVLEDEIKETKFMRNEKQYALSQLIQ